MLVTSARLSSTNPKDSLTSGVIKHDSDERMFTYRAIKTRLKHTIKKDHKTRMKCDLS